MSNAWVTHPLDGDSPQKCGVIPDKVPGAGARGGKELLLREGSGPRPISIGTEIRPRLLREAAAKNIPQWAKA